jgi:catechol 2,3-dioxygenase
MGIAHLAHAELRVTDLEASRDFFTRVLGLHVSLEDDNHVYLRAWQDWDHHSLVLTRAESSGLEHVAWRVDGPDAVGEFEGKLKGLGVETSWVEGGTGVNQGHGDALRFFSPAGVPTELFWEVEKHVEKDPALQSKLPSHPTRYTGNGVHPRRFDHVNFLTNEPQAEQEFWSEAMGVRHNYFITGDLGNGEQRLASWMAKTNLSHEIAFMRNKEQTGSLLHHVAYYVDTADQMTRAATILADAGVKIEWGPGQHGTSGAIFLYCWEPSGNRIEVWSGGFLLFAPDWEPIRWDPETSPLGLEMWGSDMPDTYLRYGTPLSTPAAAPQPA